MRNKGLDLRHHSFGRAMRGLDETEVLSFLQATAPDYEQAHADVEFLRQQLDETAAELRRLQDQERTVTRLLVAAEEDARVRLEATAKDVAEIERKADERARALLASAEAQRVKMLEEVRALVARRSIAASGLTELIDGLSRRAGQVVTKPVGAAPAAPPVRMVAPVPAAVTTPVVEPPVVATPAVAPPAAASAVAAQPRVQAAAVEPPPAAVAPPVAIAVPPPVAPALTVQPMSVLGLSAIDTLSAEESEAETANVLDAPLAEESADSSESAAESTESEAPRSNRAWWVAAAGVVLAVSTAAALGFPRIGKVAEPPPAADLKPAAQTPKPKAKPVASGTTEARQPSPAPPPAVAAPSAPLAVTLKANRQCWLRLVVDGRTETKTLAEGEELSRNANREIELRVGDAAAIAVIVNGRALAPLGRNGQVVDTVFHADLSGAR